MLLGCCGWESGLRIDPAEQIQRCSTAAEFILSSSQLHRDTIPAGDTLTTPHLYPHRPLVFFSFFITLEILTLPEMSQLHHGDFCQLQTRGPN